MKEIKYAGGSFVTSDEIAVALLEYGAALANAERAATVSVPAVGLPDGASDMTVLLGPSSQLMAEPVERVGPDPDGTGFLRRVDERTKSLQRTVVYSVDDMSDWDI